ncbi:hypothetical protein HUN21_10925 [Acinetobacter oleivorans]|nr:hypothetical protein [Acinetobacter oleivorans]
MSGWLRANIQDKDYSDNEHKLKFDAAKIAVKYDAKNLFGNFEYRCYQFDKLCDFSSLVDANLGYKFNENNRVTLGVQEIPFGPGRGWSTSWYGGVLINAGLEDVHNLGISYSTQPFTTTKFDAAFFARDAGNYTGNSKDSSRYSANYVDPDNDNDPYVKEKNMFIVRVQQEVPVSAYPDFKLTLGSSYWYSDIENKDNFETGHRNAWALFSKINYKNAHITLTAGKNKVSNHDELGRDYSVIGSFDSSYNLVNEGDFYTADINYVFKDVIHGWSLTPYATYSALRKDPKDFKTSTRNIIGVQADKGHFSVAAEYMLGKNDPFIGGNADSFAQGDDKGWSRLLNLLFFYNF